MGFTDHFTNLLKHLFLLPDLLKPLAGPEALLFDDNSQSTFELPF